MAFTFKVILKRRPRDLYLFFFSYILSFCVCCYISIWKFMITFALLDIKISNSFISKTLRLLHKIWLRFITIFASLNCLKLITGHLSMPVYYLIGILIERQVVGWKFLMLIIFLFVLAISTNKVFCKLLVIFISRIIEVKPMIVFIKLWFIFVFSFLICCSYDPKGHFYLKPYLKCCFCIKIHQCYSKAILRSSFHIGRY